MTETQWHFASHEDGTRDIQDAVATFEALLEEGKHSLDSLAAVLQHSSSELYQNVQQHWNEISKDLNSALQNLAHTVAVGSRAQATTPQE
jgi:early secretory antigenic target protein ESAT-6